MRTSSCLSKRVAAGLLALTGLLVTAAVNAAPVDKLVGGKTKPGDTPGLKGEKRDAVIAAAAQSDDAVGVTIWYRVLDRMDEAAVKKAGDTFGMKYAGADGMFVGNDGKKLDTEARYLYLYQVVNGSGRKASVKDVAVRLLVDPSRITSVGYFADSKTRMGLTFAQPSEKKDAKDAGIRPVAAILYSPLVKGEQDKQLEYKPQAPALVIERPEIGPFKLKARVKLDARERQERKALRRAAPAADRIEPPANGPDAVTIHENASFKWLPSEDIDPPPYVDKLLLRRIGAEAEMGDEARTRFLRKRWRDNWPAVKALWQEEYLEPHESSTLFGFTSNVGPVLHDTEVVPVPDTPADDKAGNQVRLFDARTTLAASDEAGPGVDRLGGRGAANDQLVSLRVPADFGRFRRQAGATPTPNGIVATPALADVTPASAPVAAPGGGGLGGVGGVGGLGGVPVGGLGGLGGRAVPSVPGVFAPAGLSGGGGLAGTSGSGNNGTTGTGTTGTTGTTTGTTNNNIIDVSQSQAQSQRQSQSQSVTVNSNGNCCDQGCHHGNIVPAPPAWLLGVLGLPVFVFVSRRRKAGEAAAENPVN